MAAPTWSATGGDLLYVRDNALWLIPMRLPTGALSTAPAPAGRPQPVRGQLAERQTATPPGSPSSPGTPRPDARSETT